MGGKIIDFGGWALPVQYTGILQEHWQVRSAAGLFDVSHMGEIMIRGAGAADFIQRMITNDISPAREGQVTYSPMCYPDGGVVDDLLVYKYSGAEYLLVVNAVNTEKDFRWFSAQLSLDGRSRGAVEIADVSEDFTQLALQGPRAEEILQKLTAYPLREIKFYHFTPEVELNGITAMVSRTGYTGEDGFELYLSSEDAPRLWEELLAAGEKEGLVPAGLGARDTLRFETALPLYGQELSPEVTPLEAGLGRFVKLAKGDFIGKAALVKQIEEGIPRKLVGFEMIDRGVPRSHYEVKAGEETIGFVTSGNYSPSLKKNIGLALVKTEYATEGAELEIVIREKALKAKVVKKPFYSKK